MQDVDENVKKIFGQEQLEVLKKINHKLLTLKTQQAKNKAAVIVLKARVDELENLKETECSQ
jgi:hypothetical protein